MNIVLFRLIGVSRLVIVGKRLRDCLIHVVGMLMHWCHWCVTF